jgi:shikimate kinase
MGTGKSTVGKLLAERVGWQFSDTDEVIVSRAEMPISEIFSNHGEAYFRSLESNVLREILNVGNQVLATGGGAVLAEENRICMLQNGFVVALKADPEVIIRRVSMDQSRPLLQGNLQERVHSLLEQRKHAYHFAHAMINTSNLTTEQIVKQIIEMTGKGM